MAVAIRQLLGDGGRVWMIAVACFVVSLVALFLAPVQPGDHPGVVEMAAMWLLPVSGPLAFLLARNWKMRLGFVGFVALAWWLTDLGGEEWFQCGPPWFGRPVCERVFNVTVILTVAPTVGLLLLLGRAALRAIDRRGTPMAPR